MAQFDLHENDLDDDPRNGIPVSGDYSILDDVDWKVLLICLLAGALVGAALAVIF